MVQYSPVDRTFAALADPTRRGVLERLGRGSATITELAEPFGISLTGMKKHVRVLEDAELVATEKVGRTRRCSLGPRRLDDVQEWIETLPADDGRTTRPLRGAPRTHERSAAMSSDQQQARTATVTTPTETEIRLERVFDAPREHVFAAFTDPELIPEWWGPGTTVDEMDVRPGGSWRFVTAYPRRRDRPSAGRSARSPRPSGSCRRSSRRPCRAASTVETFTFEELGEGTRRHDRPCSSTRPRSATACSGTAPRAARTRATPGSTRCSRGSPAEPGAGSSRRRRGAGAAVALDRLRDATGAEARTPRGLDDRLRARRTGCRPPSRAGARARGAATTGVGLSPRGPSWRCSGG